MQRRSNRRTRWATLDAAGVNSRKAHMAAARLSALVLLAATAVVPATTSIGPVMLIVWPDRGLHALDVGLILVGLPAAVALLRYAESLSKDDET